jgi:hypothetical protein
MTRTCRSVAPQPEVALLVVGDAHAEHEMTEAMIDAWGQSLPAEEKADLYEAALEDESDDELAAMPGFDGVHRWELTEAGRAIAERWYAGGQTLHTLNTDAIVAMELLEAADRLSRLGNAIIAEPLSRTEGTDAAVAIH